MIYVNESWHMSPPWLRVSQAFLSNACMLNLLHFVFILFSKLPLLSATVSGLMSCIHISQAKNFHQDSESLTFHFLDSYPLHIKFLNHLEDRYSVYMHATMDHEVSDSQVVTSCIAQFSRQCKQSWQKLRLVHMEHVPASVLSFLLI